MGKRRKKLKVTATEGEQESSSVSSAVGEEATSVSSGAQVPKTSQLKNICARKVSPHTCPVCDKTFRRKAILQSHLRTHAPKETYDCATCEKQFTSQHLLEAHLVSHSTKYKCTVCNRKYLSRKILMKHQETSHGLVSSEETVDKTAKDDDKKLLGQAKDDDKKLSAQALRETSNDKVRFQSDSKSPGSQNPTDLFYCPKCERIISHKLFTDNHIYHESVHSFHRIQHVQRFLTVCPCHTCKSDMTPHSDKEADHSQKTLLSPKMSELASPDEHRKSESVNESQIDDAGSSDPTSNEENKVRPSSKQKKFSRVIDKQFLCSKCGRLFDSERLLVDHMKDHLQCAKCAKMFNTAEDLEIHLQTLGAERLLACCLCQDILHGKKELHRHITEHLQDKDCQSVLNRLQEKRYLTKMPEHSKGSNEHSAFISEVHRRPKLKINKVTHSGENKVKCSQCGKNVPLRHGFKEHMQTNKEGVSPQASKSGEEFVYISWFSHPLMSKKEMSEESYCKCKPDIENLLANDALGSHHNPSSRVLTGGVAGSSRVTGPQAVGVPGNRTENLRIGLNSVFARSNIEVVNDGVEPAVTGPDTSASTADAALNSAEVVVTRPSDVEDRPVVKSNNSQLSSTTKTLENPQCLLLKVSAHDKANYPVAAAGLVSSPGFVVRLVNSGTEGQSVMSSGTLQSGKVLADNRNSSPLTGLVASQSSATGKVFTSNREDSSVTTPGSREPGKALVKVTDSHRVPVVDSISSQGRAVNVVASSALANSVVANSAVANSMIANSAVANSSKEKVKTIGTTVFQRRFIAIPMASGANLYLATPPVSCIGSSDGALANHVMGSSEKGSVPLQNFGDSTSTNETVRPIKSEFTYFQYPSDQLKSGGGHVQSSSCLPQDFAADRDCEQTEGGLVSSVRNTNECKKSPVLVKQESDMLDDLGEQAEHIGSTIVKSEVLDLDIDIKEEWDITWV